MRFEEFFKFAKERHSIYLKKSAGLPKPWTDDPILQQYRFTNVFRELDRTTVWFKENVRDRLRNSPEILLATVVFRWFNRISTGEAIFNKYLLIGSDENKTAWSSFYETGDLSCLRLAINSFCRNLPIVTGAYIIKSPTGMNKLDGILYCIDKFCAGETKIGQRIPNHVKVANDLLSGNNNRATLKSVWEWLCQFPYLGDFMAYEIVCDLRHTALMYEAPDILTWANPGPGAMRGLNRMFNRDINFKMKKEFFIEEMRSILAMSQDSSYWPSEWLKWEMREVEHTLCEWDKYQRVLTGQGRPRGVYC